MVCVRARRLDHAFCAKLCDPVCIIAEDFAIDALVVLSQSRWRLIESGRFDVRRIPIDDVIPLDVDTWDDYQRLLLSVSR